MFVLKHFFGMVRACVSFLRVLATKGLEHHGVHLVNRAYEILIITAQVLLLRLGEAVHRCVSVRSRDRTDNDDDRVNSDDLRN